MFQFDFSKQMLPQYSRVQFSHLLVPIVCGLLLVANVPGQETSPTTNEVSPEAFALNLTDENRDSWKQHILPTDEELAWKQINWLPDLKSAIDSAGEKRKPILLWTMNGHPFGCT